MSLLRSALQNFAGSVLPALAALITVPVIVAHLGEATYGLFALVTSVVGYFAVLDINASAGAVRYVAAYHATAKQRELAEVFSFAGAIYLLIGLVGGAALALFARPLVTQVFNIAPTAQAEALLALQIGGLAFAIGQLQVFLQSVIQALRRYDISSRLEASFGTIASLLTLAVVLAGGGLVGIVLARLLLSVVNLGAQLLLLRRLLPELRLAKPRAQIRRDILSFSGWAYLSRLAALSAANADKILIGALADMRQLALYAVPLTLASRVFAMVFRLGQVVFPYASALNAQQDHAALERIYLQATRYITALNASLALLLVAFAPELIQHWMRGLLGAESARVLMVLALAIMVDSLTNIPSLINDGVGHPRLTGTAAVLRAAATLGAVYLALQQWGIQGAAFAQLGVSVIATVAFLLAVHRYSVKTRLRDVLAQAYLPSIPLWLAAALLLGVDRASLALQPFFAAAACVAALLAAYAWHVVISPPHRLALRRRLVGASR